VLDVSLLPTYTFRRSGSPHDTITVTDPGRGLVTGHFIDLGKTKGPVLRGLAARAPYFHNGSAPDLGAVIDFYNARFGLGLSAAERSDLIAFLGAL
jgi:cytochrome c peroxidase